MKLNSQQEMTGGAEIPVEGKLMSEIFENVYKVVVNRLEEVKQAQMIFDYDQPDPNVFRNEVYIKQNLRVNYQERENEDVLSHFEKDTDKDDDIKYNRDTKHDD